MKEHFRFKAKIKEINGPLVTIETFDYVENVPRPTVTKLVKHYEGPFIEVPIIISKKLIGRKIRCIG